MRCRWRSSHCFRSAASGLRVWKPWMPSALRAALNSSRLGDNVEALQARAHAQDLHGHLAARWGLVWHGAAGGLAPTAPDTRAATHGAPAGAPGAGRARARAPPRSWQHRQRSQRVPAVLRVDLGLGLDPLVPVDLVRHAAGLGPARRFSLQGLALIGRPRLISWGRPAGEGSLPKRVC